jgi:hypothetical protein
MDRKEIVRSIEHAVADGALDELDRYYAADVVDHNPFPGQGPGLRGLRDKVAMLGAGLSDLSVAIDLLVEEADLVVDHWIGTGQHTGELMGIPATAGT